MIQEVFIMKRSTSTLSILSVYFKHHIEYSVFAIASMTSPIFRIPFSINVICVPGRVFSSLVSLKSGDNPENVGMFSFVGPHSLRRNCRQGECVV